jgi:Mlc titration factor MtfA (ptsG expression regulator)
VALFGKSRRRERLRAKPFPDHWRRIVETRVPIISRLGVGDQRELLGHTRVLVEEKHFEGASGLLMRDEIRLTIAAQAAVLLLHRETDYFPRLTSVIVYPTGYVAPNQHAEGGIWSEEEEHLSGHTQRNLHALVLAWDDVRAGAADLTTAQPAPPQVPPTRLRGREHGRNTAPGDRCAGAVVGQCSAMRRR